ncbi:MAG: diguanylate cyclase [Ruminobacter sp.]|nr:diguanylate cyclase [Ruminobacter sp.]
MYYSAIGLLAVIILLIENKDILLNCSRDTVKPVRKVYRRFLYAVLGYYVTDILWGILENQKLSLLLFADTSIYFIVMAIGVFLWTHCIIVYLEEKNFFGSFLSYAGRFIAILVASITILNIFFPVLFVVTDDCVYQALATRYVILVIQIALLLLISGYAVSSLIRKVDVSRKIHRYWTIAFFGIIMALCLFVQLWFPYYPLYAIGYMLGTSLISSFVIAEERDEYRRGLAEAIRIKELKQSITTLIDHMPALCFSKDAKSGVYLACNQVFAEYAHKKKPEGVVGLTDGEIFDAVTAGHFTEDDRMALAMEQPYIFFEEVPDAAGNLRQLQTTKLKFIDPAGRLCILGMSQDITDMVRIQRENAMTREAYENARSTGILYSYIAKALSRGYKDLFYVNIDTDEFIEYRTDGDDGVLTESRRGVRFFDEVGKSVYADDQQFVLDSMNKSSLMEALSKNKIFMMTYRRIGDKGPYYVTMKVSCMEEDKRFIIIGVTDVDEQVRQHREVERVKEERIAYTRINALTGDFLSVYLVVPETGLYREYSVTPGFENFFLPKKGDDLFADVKQHIGSIIYHEDLDRFLSMFSREGVFSEIEHNGIYALSFRLVISGKPVYVKLKAAIIDNETDGRRMVVGINNIDVQVRQEENYERRLAQAQNIANTDALTGVQNRHAYMEAEERLNRQITEHRQLSFAIVIFDVNDLKKVNDNVGHQAGDEILRSACKTISGIFGRTSVFRVGGDEFVAIIQGDNFEMLDDMIRKLEDHNTKASITGGVVIAGGMAKFENDSCVASIFDRADRNMYLNKVKLKEKISLKKISENI